MQQVQVTEEEAPVWVTMHFEEGETRRESFPSKISTSSKWPLNKDRYWERGARNKPWFLIGKAGLKLSLKSSSKLKLKFEFNFERTTSIQFQLSQGCTFWSSLPCDLAAIPSHPTAPPSRKNSAEGRDFFIFLKAHSFFKWNCIHPLPPPPLYDPPKVEGNFSGFHVLCGTPYMIPPIYDP